MLMSPPDTDAPPPLIGDHSQLEAAQALTSPFRDGGLEMLLRQLSPQIDWQHPWVTITFLISSTTYFLDTAFSCIAAYFPDLPPPPDLQIDTYIAELLATAMEDMGDMAPCSPEQLEEAKMALFASNEEILAPLAKVTLLPGPIIQGKKAWTQHLRKQFTQARYRKASITPEAAAYKLRQEQADPSCLALTRAHGIKTTAGTAVKDFSGFNVELPFCQGVHSMHTICREILQDGGVYLSADADLPSDEPQVARSSGATSSTGTGQNESEP
jgi:hypothetical protein